MKKLILFVSLFLSLFLIGCAQNTWYKPTAKQGEFEKDRYDCLQQSQQQFSAAQTNGWQGAAVSKTVTNDGLFASCMSSRGWSIQNQQAVQQQIQQQQLNISQNQSRVQNEQTKFKDRIDQICTNPEYKLYYAKTACRQLDITFEQLADSSKITQQQKAVLVKWRATADAYFKENMAFQRTLGVRGNKIADLQQRFLVPKSESMALDLYNGKITWGEYNKQRKEMAIEFQNRISNIPN